MAIGGEDIQEGRPSPASSQLSHLEIKHMKTISNECVLLWGPWYWTAQFCVLETVPSKTDPHMVDCIVGENIWLNLHLCACIVGTKNSTVVCQREKRSLCVMFTFTNKQINQITRFQNMNLMVVENENK
jgi:hypothetical protein